MLTKTTTKLFYGTYQYKIVLVSPFAGSFRLNDYNSIIEDLENRINPEPPARFSIYARKLAKKLDLMADYSCRVEYPWVSIYTNSKKDIDDIIKLGETPIKYVSIPPDNIVLIKDEIVMHDTPYDFRVTLGYTNQNYSSFVAWAENNSSLKLTKSCIAALNSNRSWGGSYFYVLGDNNLLMTKLHIGGAIAKIERIIKAV